MAVMKQNNQSSVLVSW